MVYGAAARLFRRSQRIHSYRFWKTWTPSASLVSVAHLPAFQPDRPRKLLRIPTFRVLALHAKIFHFWNPTLPLGLRRDQFLDVNQFRRIISCVTRVAIFMPV